MAVCASKTVGSISELSSVMYSLTAWFSDRLLARPYGKAYDSTASSLPERNQQLRFLCRADGTRRRHS
jgi:hypothetical protein